MIRYPIKVLLVDQNADQLLMSEKALRRSMRQIEVLSVRTATDCLGLLSREEIAIVVLDYCLPDFDGLETIRQIKQAGYDTPVVMVTGQGDEQVAVTAMKEGAADYVVKAQGYLNVLPGILERAIEKYQLKNRLKASEERYQRLAENANDLIFTIDRDGHFLFFTNRAVSVLGQTDQELRGRDFKDFLTLESRKRAELDFLKKAKGRVPWMIELDFVSPTGEIKSFELSVNSVVGSGVVTGFEVIGRDITERKSLEKKVLQKNKELTTLLSVTSTISHSLNIDEVASITLEKICAHSSLNCGAIYTFRYADSEFVRSAAYNLSKASLESMDGPGFWNEIQDAVLRVRAPLVHPSPSGTMEETALDKIIAVCRRETINSFIILPFFFNEKFFGLAFAGSFAQNCFAAEQSEILNAICEQVSAAIANAGLFKAVNEAKNEWETTFDAMPELICIQDLTGKIMRVNATLARRLNSEPRQLVNRSAEDVFKDPMSPWVHHHRKEIYERDKIVSVEYEDRLLDGIFEIATTPIYTSSGRLLAWLFVGKDITEQRQFQNQVVQVERLKALGEMASGVAHDFNNILAGILGKTQVMLNQLEKEGRPDLQTWKQNLKTLEKQAILGARTVKRIQDFTRIRTDKKFTPVDLNQVVTNSIEIIKPVWKDESEAKGIKIEFRFHPGEISLVDGIDSELTEVVVNVLSNALDAMPDGGVIEVSSRDVMDGGSPVVELTVTDTGVGMSSEVLQKVFDPFFSTKGPKGIGLGMSVAYGVVTRHHGRIELLSELGKGTTCAIRFPVSKQAEMSGLAGRTSPREKRARILVIDDEDVIREFMQEMLVSSDFDADVASTGSEGIGLFEKNSYNLVFSDLGLPGMSGWDVAKTLKQRNPDVPIILLSGWGIQLDDVRVKQSGVDLVLSKPCQMNEILGAVDEILKRPKRSNG